MFVAEAAVSSIFDLVLQKLVAAPLLQYARRHDVENTLNEWRRILLHIEAVLTDAEQKQVRDRSVKLWLDDLKSLAYDMEDVLDDFDTEANRQILIPCSSSKVHKLIPTFFDPTSVKFKAKIGKKIKKISRELEAVAKRRNDFNLREDVRGLSFEMEERLQTTSLVDESGIFGRDAEKEDIVQFLLSDEASRDDTDHGVSVVPIVGMGGVGKTTLAQMIYNDERVERHFDTMTWVCVSDRFDVVGITKAILESVTRSSTDSRNLQSLQNELKNQLNGKRYFLVLDDVWNEKPQNWDALKAPFRAGAQGSMIIVTTRSEDVASIMRTTSSSHHLDVLSYEECCLLFAKHAFAGMNANIRLQLEPIGMEIVRKCRGLPLAAKTLGSLLHSKQDKNAWNEVLNNDIWDLPNEKSNFLPALYLSKEEVMDLPNENVKRKLVLLWMAEGLLGGSKKEETMEDYGNMCFDNLLSKSFFQRADDDRSGVFLMHDLIHDLAQSVSGKFCSSLDDEKKSPISEQTRHSSYIMAGKYELSKKFDPFFEAHNLRTFLPVFIHRLLSSIYLSEKISNHLFPTLKCLRVLSLAKYRITKLPDSIGTLKHLRYLDLSSTSITRLPESVTDLLNLQTLMLSNCPALTYLPAEMGKLISLRHLDVTDTILKEMPVGMKGLKHLRTLTGFVIGEDSGAKIKELRDMSHLGGRLCISKLQNVVDAMDVLDANLKGKELLEELEMQWDDNSSDRDLQKETTVLEELQPHNNLKQLIINGYCGGKFPNWLCKHSSTNMVSLHLHNCINCSSLPSLGQLGSLKNLSIKNIHRVQRLGDEFCENIGHSLLKPFSSLESLTIEGMLEWEEWDSLEVEFPSLKKLSISNCPKLRRHLPKQLPKLTELKIYDCKQLVCCLPMAPSISKLKIRGCEDVVVRSVGSLTSLASLTVEEVCKIPVELGQLQSLLKLYLCKCPELKEMPPILHNLASLKDLEITKCDSLLSLPEMGLPPMLESLTIEYCPVLGSLPEGMMQNITTLRHLFIHYCEKLELALAEDTTHNHNASLSSLTIINSCGSLTSFPLAFFTKLEVLRFDNCDRLECLYIPDGDGLHHVDLTSLQILCIYGCPNLVSFPSVGLPIPNLKTLHIVGCKKLKSLPQGMHTLLTSLQDLYITDCPEIDSLPEGGLPTTLYDLLIHNCCKLMACRTEWCLHSLPVLRRLLIGGSDEERLESFPEAWFLPSTLTVLEIYDFPNLKLLDSKGLQHLNSLETLEIGRCEKLKYLPKQRLPSSLSHLYINDCPTLKKRCRRDKGKEWSNISHIPCIIFDPFDDEKREVILP